LKVQGQAMAGTESIFTWEGISLPSYWGGNFGTLSGQAAMDAIKATGADTITLVPNFFQDNGASTEVKLNLSPDPTKPWLSESDTLPQVQAAIQDAVARGFKVVVKPHVERNDRNNPPVIDPATGEREDPWRAKIAPSDPKTWFANYKAMMVDYAKAAQAGGASMFVVGTEMRSMTDPTKVCSDNISYTQKWGEIIEAVRTVFSGKVTYAATDDEALRLQFWDKLDYIGVDAYFSMAVDGTLDPTVQQLIDSWIKPPVNWNSQQVYGTTSVVDTWKHLSEQWGKKVIFTEIGYAAYNGTNQSPGWLRDLPEDLGEQRDCYEALYHVMQNYGGQWLDGAFLWSYQTTTDPDYVKSNDYTPQGKPANLIITAGYSGPEHVAGITQNGNAEANKLDGGYHNDVLNGAGGRDVLWGGAGHDVLNGGADNDALDGGSGTNTAVFSGARADYVITRNSDGTITVADKQAGRDGSDQLKNIQHARFSDQTYNLQTSTAEPTTPTPTTPTPMPTEPTPLPVESPQVLIGTRKRDTLKGGLNDDKLYGGYGNDTLTGNVGKDVFVFNAKLGTSKTDRKVNFDTIKDYNVKDDAIWLDNKIFTKLGRKGTETKPAKLDKKFFKFADKLQDANDYLVYNKKTGVLSYDKDGSDTKSKPVEVAKLAKNLKMAAAEFFVV
jgi:serralysin